MSEMVQRVALAIKAEIGRQLGAVPLHGDKSSTDWYVPNTPDPGSTLDLTAIGRCAIAAMREPTEGMKFKGYKIGATNDLTKMVTTWQAMIDEALR